MPVIYLSKALYDKLIELGEDPGEFVETAAVAALKKLKDQAAASQWNRPVRDGKEEVR